MNTIEKVFESRYPSATRLTRMFTPAQFPNTIPAHILDNAAKKGTAFHKFAQKYVNDVTSSHEYIVPLYDVEYAEYEEQFVKWFNTRYDPDEIYFTEVPFIDDELKIKGFIDLVMYNPHIPEMQVFDYKTSAKMNKFSYPLQVQTYMEAAYSLGPSLIGIPSFDEPDMYGSLIQFTKTKYKEVSVSMAPEGMVKGLSDTFAEYEEIFRKEDKKKS